MHLAEAIRAWGRAHRSEIEPDEFRAVGVLYKAVRGTDLGVLDVTSMSKDDARAVMALFEAEERKANARRLNTVRKWVLAEERSAAEADAERVEPVRVEPEQADAPAEEPSGGDDEPTEDTTDYSEADAAAFSGDVQEIIAPEVEQAANRDKPVAWFLVGATVLILAGLISLLFLRPSDSADPVQTAPPDPAEVTRLANEAFLDELNLAPDLRACLADEFDDLPRAATDMSQLERPVCGTNLLTVIDSGS